MADTSRETLANLLREQRSFPPPPDLAAHANLHADAYMRAAENRIGYWEEQARTLHWDTPWTKALHWQHPHAKWFVDGKLNAAYNCVDRHVEAGYGDTVALHWEGEPGDTLTVTYAQLQEEIAQAAHALTELGVQAGDRVMIYLPMLPEAAISMLACARIGAVHSVVFAGFSADSLRTRVLDADARVVICADGVHRKGEKHALKTTVDDAIADTSVERVLVVRRTGQDVPIVAGRDVWWDKLVAQQPREHTPQAFDAEHPLFILYTSGTTGKPKGILHTTGGYLTQAAYTHSAVFDHKPGEDVYWCTADVGWVTGHTYVTYGPLLNRATQVLYEGTPDTPHPGRWWELVEKYGVTILYTAPTAIRSFSRSGDEIPAQYDLSSLRVLGSVGEPINPEAWMWYRDVIGGSRAALVDTWWQTETGAIMLSPLPGVTETKPGAAQRPLPGISADVVSDAGASVPDGSGGYLAITEPWPSQLRGIWGDEERYQQTYWKRFEQQGYYFPGDGAKKDEDGDIWLLGRVDDIMLVSGHNISTTEVESALVSHDAVAEAAVVGAHDEITGQAIVAFVVMRQGAVVDQEELRAHVGTVISPIAKPKRIFLVPELPKTRSGKIMRRLLRDIAENRELGDVTTLADASIVEVISQMAR